MIIFDEYKYAKGLLAHGFMKFMSNTDLTILAKYLRYIGKTDEQIKQDLNEFCLKHNPEFNPVISRNNLDAALKKSKKRFLVIPQPIPITQQEIDSIKRLKDYKSEKVAFVLLVIAKHFRINLGWKIYVANIKKSEIFSRAKITSPKPQKDAILTKLDRDFGLIDTMILGSTQDASIRVAFVDEKSEPIFVVDDLDRMVEFYHPHCNVCGKDTHQEKKRSDGMCNCCRFERNKKIKKQWAR
jgi:hypothetical protein